MKRSLAALSLALTACATTPAPAPAPEAPVAAAPAAPPKVDESFRAKAPEPAAPPAVVTPVFQKATLKNGLTVLVSERHELPLVSLNVAFAAGSASDPKGKAGLADLTFRLPLEGAGEKDAMAIDNAFADLGVSPSVSVRPDGALLGVRVLSRNADPALTLLADLVKRPKFAAADFERKKKEQLADLALRIGNPRYLAQEAFAATVFGEGHPYGHVGTGTPKSVTALTLADAKGFYGKNAGPKAAALVFTGDVTLEQAVAWGEKHFGDWKGSATPSPVPPIPKVALRTGVVFVPKPGLNQTLIVMGRPAIAAGHPDEEALELASTVFGGFFGSRLNMNLRESKGYSYGAAAYFDARKGVGPLLASSSVRADVTGPSLTEFMRELNGLKSNAITQVELDAAREGVIRSVPGMFETVDDLAGSAATLFFQNLPLDRYTKMIEKLQSADPASVQKAAELYFDPRSMQVVLVGDPKVVGDQVPPLDIGKLKTRPAPVGAAAAPTGTPPSAGVR